MEFSQATSQADMLACPFGDDIGKSKCYELLKDMDCPFCVVKLGRTVRIAGKL